MSEKSGLLTEDEIRSYLIESFNFKVDRDALLKPTRAIVQEIYTRFLDGTHRPWRRGRFDESGLKFQIVICIRRMIDRYNTPYTFQMVDLISPTRKRFMTFLNVLIYTRAQYENFSALREEWKNNWAQNQDAIDQVNREICKKKQEIKELMQTNANFRPLEELSNCEYELRKTLKALEIECENKKQQPIAEAKELIEVQAQQVEAKEAESKRLDEEVLKREKTLKSLNDVPDIEKKIAEAEQDIRTKSQIYHNGIEKLKWYQSVIAEHEKLPSRMIKNENIDLETLAKDKEKRNLIESRTEEARKGVVEAQNRRQSLEEQIAAMKQTMDKRKLHNKIKLAQMDKDLESKLALVAEESTKHNAFFERKQNMVDKANRESEELAVKEKTMTTEYQDSVEKVNKQIELVRKQYLESENLEKKANIVLQREQEQLDALVGRRIVNANATKDDVQVAVNMTYIKNSHE